MHAVLLSDFVIEQKAHWYGISKKKFNWISLEWEKIVSKISDTIFLIDIKNIVNKNNSTGMEFLTLKCMNSFFRRFSGHSLG